jgi:hypothetical protein
MSTIQLLIVCATLLWLAGIALPALTRQAPAPAPPSGIYDGLCRGQVVSVGTGDGQTVVGAVHEQRAGYLLLIDAKVLTPGQAEQPLPGMTRLAQHGVQVVQEVPGTVKPRLVAADTAGRSATGS